MADDVRGSRILDVFPKQSLQDLPINWLWGCDKEGVGRGTEFLLFAACLLACLTVFYQGN